MKKHRTIVSVGAAFLILVAIQFALTRRGQFVFGDTPLNKTLPDDYKNRVLWTETDIFKYNLEQLVGHVIVHDPATGTFARGARHVSASKPPTLKAIEGGTLYHSKIDSRAASEGSYLAFAAKLSEEQTASVTITDTAHIFIPYEEIPSDAILQEAHRPKATPNCKRYYIQGVLLTAVTTEYGTKLASDASGVVGDTFGAKGNVYNEDATLTKDVRISVLLLDVDDLAAILGGQNLRPEDRYKMMRAAAVTGLEVRGLEGAQDLVAASGDR